VQVAIGTNVSVSLSDVSDRSGECLPDGHGRSESGERRGEKDGGGYLDHCHMFVSREKKQWRPSPKSKWNQRRKSTAGGKKTATGIFLGFIPMQ
jgi:hypothetical protein